MPEPTGEKSMSAPADELEVDAAESAEPLPDGAMVEEKEVTKVEPSDVTVDSTAVTDGVTAPVEPLLPLVVDAVLGVPDVVK